MIEEDRLRAAQRGMRERAKLARKSSERQTVVQFAASLRGKAKGYEESADMIESLIRIGTIHRKWEN